MVCALNSKTDLHADHAGNPFTVHAGQGLRPAGWCGELWSFIAVHGGRKVWERVEEWMADPASDCLRARGDIRWQAACRAQALACVNGERIACMVGV